MAFAASEMVTLSKNGLEERLSVELTSVKETVCCCIDDMLLAAYIEETLLVFEIIINYSL